jgi:hypothetical protein
MLLGIGVVCLLGAAAIVIWVFKREADAATAELNQDEPLAEAGEILG